jgi:hypothetical protein
VKIEHVPPSALDTCGTCGTKVIWTVTHKGRRMMVNTDAGAPGSNLALTVVSGEVRSRVVAAHLAYGNPGLHLTHFATCPQANTHRRTRRRSHAERRMS